MNQIGKRFCFILTAVLLVLQVGIARELTAGDFYVAPNGSDTNPGTLLKPFATLEKARDAVRVRVGKGLTQDTKVLVRGGTYRLDEPLHFGPDDSGTADHSITYAAYPGEAPLISGGRVITGWKNAGQGKWVAQLPKGPPDGWQFRQLFADNVRLPRARFPNAPEVMHIKTVSEDIRTIQFDQALGADDLAGKNAELVVYLNWSINRAILSSSQDATVQSTIPVSWMGSTKAASMQNRPAYVENAPAWLDAPGEWYLDTNNGTLTYMAGADENPNKRRFIAPVVEQFIVVQGTPDRPVRNLHFEGLTLEHAAWPLPEMGYIGIQAGHHGSMFDGPTYVLPSAILLTQATDCELERCRLAHTGACGIALGAGCQRNRIVGCDLSDIGGNGIMIGWRGRKKHGNAWFLSKGAHADDWQRAADIPVANEVAHCTVQSCGAVTYGCVGIFDAFTRFSRIAHNLVSDMPYTGISVGFNWDETPTSHRDCVVEYNHIYDCMKMLADGGGIYTLGRQPGTILRGNLIHDIRRSPHAYGSANNGIFFDQGSRDYLVDGNIIYATSGRPVRFNQRRLTDFTWKDNSFGPRPGNPFFPVAAARRAGPRTLYQRQPTRTGVAAGNTLVPGRRRLFLDDEQIATMHGLTRTMHQPKKKGPVIRPGLSGSGKLTIQTRSAPALDDEQQVWKMWDCTRPDDLPKGTSACGYYESQDGLTWTRPVVGQVEWRGSRRNNLVSGTMPNGTMFRPACVVYDPTDPDSNRRFKSALPPHGFATSPDGKQWTLLDVPAVGTEDEYNFSFDPRDHQFLLTVKRNGPYGRAVFLSTSNDFAHWTEPKLTFHTDQRDQELGRKHIEARLADTSRMHPRYNDPDDWYVDVYNMGVFRYEGFYIGMPTLYHATSRIPNYPNTTGFDLIQLVCSRDLKQWQRLGNRATFIGPSRLDSGAYDLTQILPPSRAILRTGDDTFSGKDELWFYYTALKYRVPWKYVGKFPNGKHVTFPGLDADGGAICLAVLRRDGFISLDAGEQLGTLLTKPFVVNGKELLVNVDAAKGNLKVEVLDSDGKLAATSKAIVGDKTRVAVQWESGNLADLEGQTISLRFTLQNAKLYSFWMEN